MNNKYDWLIETTADEAYHMEILRGNLYDEEGKGYSIPTSQRLQAGWFGDSGTIISGEQYRQVPVKMEIEWYSYAEDKFYAGTFQLDHEKILGLFQQKLKCAYIKNGRFSRFKVSVAPGGQVFLYLSGGNTILLGQFTAQEKQVSDFNGAFGYDGSETREEIFKDFAEDMPFQTQKEIAEKNINTQIWKDINQRYPWKFTWKVEDQSPKLTMDKDKKGVDFLSGESMWCISGSNYLIEPEPKPIPIRINGSFETSAGRNFTINVSPGNIDGKELRYQSYEPYREREQALVKQFKQFYKKIGEQEFEINLRIDENYNTGKVFLKKGNVEEEIPNVQVQILDNTFGK